MLMANIVQSIALIRSGGLEYQFRTTVVPGLHDEDELTSLHYMFRNDPYVTHPFSADGPDGIIADWMEV